VVERFVERALQTDEVARKQNINDLPPTVFQRLVSQESTIEQGEEMRAMRSLVKQNLALLNAYLALLEFLQIRPLGLRWRIQAAAFYQWAAHTPVGIDDLDHVTFFPSVFLFR